MAWTHIEYGAGNYGDKFGLARDHFKILELTLDELIKERGQEGIFYVNDYTTESTALAREAVEALQREGIEVRELSGDYRYMRLVETDTANLSHPNLNYFSPDFWLDTTTRLQRLADGSREGLEITIWDYADPFFQWVRENKILNVTTTEGGFKYRSPSKKICGNKERAIRRHLIHPGHNALAVLNGLRIEREVANLTSFFDSLRA